MIGGACGDSPDLIYWKTSAESGNPKTSKYEISCGSLKTCVVALKTSRRVVSARVMVGKG
jgi:hypothetical protein